MTRSESAGLALIVVLQVALGALYATLIPAYNAPDEPAHMNFVRHVAERSELPVLVAGDWDGPLLERLKAARFPVGTDVAPIRYESHQPPLYYVLAASLVAAAPPLDERSQVLVVRLMTVGIAALGLLALHRIALEIIGDAASRLAAVGFAAFLPMRLAVAGSVTNDALAELGVSVVLWRSLVALRQGVGYRGAAVLGALAGLAALTKLSAWVALPVALLAVAVSRGSRRDRVQRSAILLGVALVLLLPWLVRGALLYGPTDPLGLARHDLVVAGQPLTGQISAAHPGAMGTTLFRSFWGQFGWMGVLMDERIYLVLGITTAVIALGLVLFLTPWGGYWSDLKPTARRGLGLLALVVFGVALGTLVYNLRYLQPQGRYLFPAMGGIGVLAALGARELIAAHQRTSIYLIAGAGLVGLDLLALYRFILPDLRG